MAYIKKKVIAGQITEIKLYHTGKQRPRGEPRRKRGNETTAAMREVNRQNAEDRLRWLMCSNFKGGEDLHITLKYDGSKNHVATPDEMEKDIKDTLEKVAEYSATEKKNLKKGMIKNSIMAAVLLAFANILYTTNGFGGHISELPIQNMNEFATGLAMAILVLNALYLGGFFEKLTEWKQKLVRK